MDDTELTYKKGYFYVHSSPNWIKNFEILAEHSRAIIIFPEISSGLFDVELSYIQKKGLLGKTIFIMPPVYENWAIFGQGISETKQDVNRPHRWEIVQREYLNKNISMPNYDPNGKIFALNSSGSGLYTCSFRSADFADFIDEVIIQNNIVNGSGSNFKDIFHRLELYKNYVTPLSFKATDDIPGYGYRFAEDRASALVALFVLLPCFLVSLLIFHNPHINLGYWIALWFFDTLMSAALIMKAFGFEFTDI